MSFGRCARFRFLKTIRGPEPFSPIVFIAAPRYPAPKRLCYFLDSNRPMICCLSSFLNIVLSSIPPSLVKRCPPCCFVAVVAVCRCLDFIALSFFDEVGMGAEQKGPHVISISVVSWHSPLMLPFANEPDLQPAPNGARSPLRSCVLRFLFGARCGFGPYCCFGAALVCK